jgi:diacylglycerol kinase (ATP)
LIALLTNPDSGRGEASEVAGGFARDGVEVRQFALGDVADAIATGPERLVVAGGDGSIASAAAAAGRAAIPLAVIPTGTANDFARALGIPLDVRESTAVAAAGGRTRRLDLAWMDERPFLNVASAGLSPAAARRAGRLKGVLGPLAYTIGALRAGFSAEPVECAVSCDDGELFTGKAWQVSVACTGAFGAGSSVDADPADASLDVVAIAAGPRTRLVRHAYGLRAGRVQGQPGVHSVRCATAAIEVAPGTTFNVDGELVKAGSSSFRIEPGAVEVVVP